MSINELYNALSEYKLYNSKEALEDILLYFTDYIKEVSNYNQNELNSYEDLLQTGYESVIVSLNNFNEQMGIDLFIPYIKDNIRTSIKNELDKTKEYYESYTYENELVEDTTLDETLNNIKISLIGDTLSNMSYEERMIIFYSYVFNEDNDYKIALNLGIHPRHIRNKKRIALLKLKNSNLKKELKKYL